MRMTKPAPHFDDEFRTRLTELFAWRRDVRRFRPDPVPEDTLTRLLAVADGAPSVGLSQPWRFVLVADTSRRADVAQSFERANSDALSSYDGDVARLYATLKLQGLTEAPVHLAVFCDLDPGKGKGLGRRTMPETLAYSTVAAIQTLWLAARAEGIGLGWVSILEPDRIGDILDVPPEWRFIAYLCIGYPLVTDDTPELERSGWEERSDPSDRIFNR